MFNSPAAFNLTERILQWGSVMLAMTAGLLALAYLADLTLKRWIAPRLRLVLYVAVFVRLLLPATWQSPASTKILTWANEVVVQFTASKAPSWPSEPMISWAPEPLSSELAAMPSMSPPRVEQTVSIDTVTAATVANPSAMPLLGIWLTYALGFGGLAARAGFGAWQVRKIVRESRELTATNAMPRLGAPLYEHSHQGPFAGGIFRPFVVVPATLRALLSEQALAKIVAHEQAHVHFRDPLVKTILTVVCMVLWPIAPLWLARLKILTLMEQGADDYALHGADWATRLDYGRLLVDLASHLPSSPRTLVSLRMNTYFNLRSRLLAVREPVSWSIAQQLVLVLPIVVMGVSCAGEAECRTTEQAQLVQVPADLTSSCRTLQAQAHFILQNKASPAQASGQILQLIDNVGKGSCPPVAEVLVHACQTLHDRVVKEGHTLADFQSVHALYKRYLSDFPQSARAYEMTFYFGELLWALANESAKLGHDESSRQTYVQAAEQYRQALHRFPAGQYQQDLVGAQLFAVNNSLGDWESQAKSVKVCAPPAGCEYPEQDYPPAAQKLVEALDMAIAGATTLDEEIKKAYFVRAKLAIEYNRFQEGENRLAALFTVDNASVRAAWAAQMLVDTLEVRWQKAKQLGKDAEARLGALRAWCDRLPTMPMWHLPEAQTVRDRVAALVVKAAWSDAKSLQEGGHFMACASAYEAMLIAHPSDKNADGMAWNAAQCYKSANASNKAKALLQHLVAKYPTSGYVAQARQAL